MGWFSERRALRKRIEAAEREMVEMTVDGLDAPLQVPASALREVTTAAVPALLKYGQIALTIGSTFRQTGAERPTGIIPGSGRMGEPKSLTSSLVLGRTFSCPHMSIGNVESASCGVCGTMRAAA
jgi:hypothetical protein